MNKILSITSAALLSLSTSVLAADVYVGSREYKILLDTTSFSGNAFTRATKVSS